MAESGQAKKWYEKGILNPIGSIATGIMSIGGKCINRFGRGLGTLTSSTESATGTLDEAVKSASIGTRGMIANLMAPFSVMRTDQEFLAKTKEALGEVWHSSIKGAVKSASMAVVDPVMTVLGADMKRNKEGKIRPGLRAKRGIIGLAVDDVLKGAWRTGTFFAGTETPDPEDEIASADMLAHERLQRRRDWVAPHYLKTRGENTEAKPAEDKPGEKAE